MATKHEEDHFANVVYTVTATDGRPVDLKPFKVGDRTYMIPEVISDMFYVLQYENEQLIQLLRSYQSADDILNAVDMTRRRN